MSIPISACLRTTSQVALLRASSYAEPGGGSAARSLLDLEKARNSGGRTRLPTCVVKILFSLRFIRFQAQNPSTLSRIGQRVEQLRLMAYINSIDNGMRRLRGYAKQ